MSDREKVLTGLECLITDEVPCKECLYDKKRSYCIKSIALDAKRLIEEQQKLICDYVRFAAVVEHCTNILTPLKEQEWISVNDRLPNCNGCYLVWRPHFYDDKGMPSICYFDGQNTWHDSYGVDFTRILKPEDISHWKPLPDQP